MKKIALIVFAALIVDACSPAGSIAALQATVAASEAALSILEATGNVSPQTAAQVIGYLQITSTDVERVAAILATTEPTTRKALEIAAAFDNLPILQDSAAQSYITAVQAAIRAFLAFYPPAGIAAAARASAPLKPLTQNDLAHVAKINSRAASLSARLTATARTPRP